MLYVNRSLDQIDATVRTGDICFVHGIFEDACPARQQYRRRPRRESIHTAGRDPGPSKAMPADSAFDEQTEKGGLGPDYGILLST